MRIFTRILVFALAVFSSAVIAALAFVAWQGGEWGANNGVLEFGTRVDGPVETRMLAAWVAGGAALLVLALGAFAAFARQRTISLWLGGQHPVQVPAQVVEQYLRTVVDDVKGVESARVVAHSAGRGTTALGVELTVAPDSDAALVQSNIESRIGSMLVPSSSIVLGGRPKITIRYAIPSMRDASGRQAA